VDCTSVLSKRKAFLSSQSYELTGGTTELVHHFRLKGELTLAQERCLTLLNNFDMVWFGYIARLSQRGGGGYFTRTNYYYLPSLRLEGGRVQHPESVFVNLRHRFSVLRNGFLVIDSWAHKRLQIRALC
jgi:hypothetical protein